MISCYGAFFINKCRTSGKYYFEIAIDGESIAPQRMTTPPQARQFKTLAAAYSYLRKFLDYRGDVSIRLIDLTTGTGST